eukprot:7011660-Pyramimonas_sp.AAC.1
MLTKGLASGHKARLATRRRAPERTHAASPLSRGSVTLSRTLRYATVLRRTFPPAWIVEILLLPLG